MFALGNNDHFVPSLPWTDGHCRQFASLGASSVARLPSGTKAADGGGSGAVIAVATNHLARNRFGWQIREPGRSKRGAMRRGREDGPRILENFRRIGGWKRQSLPLQSPKKTSIWKTSPTSAIFPSTSDDHRGKSCGVETGSRRRSSAG